VARVFNGHRSRSQHLPDNPSHPAIYPGNRYFVGLVSFVGAGWPVFLMGVDPEANTYRITQAIQPSIQATGILSV
jgi:hypothetical protein